MTEPTGTDPHSITGYTQQTVTVDVEVTDTAAVREVVVIGGGPAGMAAALAAADLGCSVDLIDGSAQLGGQYYRQLPAGMRAAHPEALHHDFAEGAKLIDRTRAHSRITLRSSTTVWAARRELSAQAADELVELQLVGVSGARSVLRARTVVLAPGAYDRALPFPGWTLPGVLTPGGAQALLKGQYVLAGQRVVVAGTGPFMLPVAAGLVEAGARVLGVFEASSPLGWRRHLATVGKNPAKLGEGRHYLGTLRRHKVPLRFGRAVTRAQGTDVVGSVTVSALDKNWHVRPGTEQTYEVDAVCVGWGFTPNVELAIALEVATAIELGDGAVVAVADAAGRTSVPSVLAAGEICGIAGNAVAVTEGRLAGLSAAARSGRISGRELERRARDLRRGRNRGREFGRALLAVYPVRPGWTGWLRPDTVLCRCEEVSVGAVREVISEFGARDLRSVKLLSRVGMGMCQGRVCSRAAGDVLVTETGEGLRDPASLSKRPIVTPVSLGALAGGAGGTPLSVSDADGAGTPW